MSTNDDATQKDPTLDDEIWSTAMKYLGDPKKPQERATASVFARVQKDLSWLFQQARSGDQRAMARLVSIGLLTVQWIKIITDGNLQFAKQSAANFTAWPTAISSAKKFPENLDDLRKRLEIGKNQPLPFDIGRRFTGKSSGDCRRLVSQCLLILHISQKMAFFFTMMREMASVHAVMNEEYKNGNVPDLEDAKQKITVMEAAMNRAASNFAAYSNHASASAENLYSYLAIPPEGRIRGIKICLRLGRATLPPISTASKDRWLEMIETMIKACCNGNPGNNEVIKRIGKSGEEKYYRAQLKGKDYTGSWRDEIKKMKEAGTAKGSEASNIWQAARGLLESAFDAITAKRNAGENPLAKTKISKQPMKKKRVGRTRNS